MKKLFIHGVFVLLLIGLGFAWGCGFDVQGSANSDERITAEIVQANVVFANKFVLKDEEDNVRGFMEASNGRVSIGFSGQNGERLLYIQGDEAGARIILGEDDAPIIAINSSKELGGAILIFDENFDIVWQTPEDQ